LFSVTFLFLPEFLTLTVMKKMLLYFTVLFLLVSASKSFSQTEGFFALYPKDGSKFVSVKNDIIIKYKDDIDGNILNDLKIDIKGTASGNHYCAKILKPAFKTVIFKPYNPFNANEKVTVTLYLTTKKLLEYSFTTSPLKTAIPIPESVYNGEFGFFSETSKNTKDKDSIIPSYLNNVPSDFPYYQVVKSDNPGVGKYFLNSGTRDTTRACYNLIIDTTGFPVFYRRFPNTHKEYFFAYHPANGLITYYDYPAYRFVALDSAFRFVRYYEAQNGYQTDIHELLIEPDNSFWVMIYDPQPFDMSQIYPGGCTSAIVIGLIIQHIDEDNNVLFQWSSWDHFSILDADTGMVDLTACVVDYVHGNGLDTDDNGNILLSSRHLSEITKINGQTGDIIWRWGGNNNQFSFENDTTPFKAQHNIRVNGSNRYSLFDNGNTKNPEFSRGVEYELDESAMTATIVVDYRKQNPPDYTPFMGSFQKLDQGGFLTGWAANWEKYVLTQYDSYGNTVFDIQSIDTFGVVSYRAQKYTWETSRFWLETDTLDFGTNTIIGDSAQLPVTVVNGLNEPLTINGYYATDSAFSLSTQLPVVISGNSSVNMMVKFKPKDVVPVSAAFYLYYQTDTSRIANQFMVTGGGIIDNIGTTGEKTGIKIFPNPATSSFTVKTSNNNKILSVVIYSLSGNKIKMIKPQRNEVSIEGLNRGMYLVKVLTDTGSKVEKVMVR
jgi:hypothetical protein